jgi:hypothetical protein
MSNSDSDDDFYGGNSGSYGGTSYMGGNGTSYGRPSYGGNRWGTNRVSVEGLNFALSFATEKAKKLAQEKPDICLKDLLTIFQGPVPKSGQLIFATTNDYDEIKKMCPALFRHSRMTPILFGYCDRKTICDMFLYYFKREPPFYIPEQTQNSSAEIIQYAMDSLCLLNHTDDQIFDIFCNLVKKNLKQ